MVEYREFDVRILLESRINNRQDLKEMRQDKIEREWLRWKIS